MKALVTRTQAALLVLCGTLLAVLIYELGAPITVLEAPQIRLQRKPLTLASPQPFMAPALASFSVINDKPVFNPLRQPIKPAYVPGEPASGALPPLVLIGIIVDGQNKLALIKMPGSPFATGVTVGEEVAGWRVSQIETDGIVVHSGSSDYTIKLNSGGATPATGNPTQQR